MRALRRVVVVWLSTEKDQSAFLSRRAFAFSTRARSSFFARSSSRRRAALKPLPPRLIKYVSMRMPDPGPLGETFFEASDRAIVEASLVNTPFAGCVESVLTFATQRCRLFRRSGLISLSDFFPVDAPGDMMES
jgi:hypothetical protein